MADRAYTLSWNLTRRCNLLCAHCYLSAVPGAGSAQELTTAECRRVMDEIARVNPNVFLILTGGEPLLRADLDDLAASASDRGFTVVVGTNGVLLREARARRLKAAGVQGASVSLDSADPETHDRFRRFPGAWQGAVRATRILRAEGLPFSIHMSVMRWNLGEIPAMIELAASLGAHVLNLFFVVRTGRGVQLADISAEEYERVLTDLARIQGGGNGLLVRARCAPHFRRILWSLDPDSPLLASFADGSCPAGKAYCRITPEGDVTPCPYMPVSAGNVRERAFAEIWETAAVFADLRDPRLGGRCGACEFSRICGGCRCRAYAASGDYLAEDPACAYRPGALGGRLVTLPEERAYGLEVDTELPWEPEARARMQAVPSFVRGMVVRAVEACARASGQTVVTPALLAETRARWGMHRRPFGSPPSGS